MFGCVRIFTSFFSLINDDHIYIDLNHFEVILASLFFQFTLYVGLRLAHRGFTLGELGLVCFGGTAFCLETFNMTIARVCARHV